ncbi:HAD family phosphatase [Vallitalea pronyensis]|uniref:HAD family phosphatase n=1 Tax=Vallitalea pronyensis TaxID=1348613 RepID=A0A8J8MLB8_9FIRM|nr:Cof-type HAD-IIB family hydrolase [Vallitalea pronyensis]QUI23512.1 HAD family phosphatase [Vallitalea pronyensis]
MKKTKHTKYELICLDLDGTLLASNHRMSERTIKTLRQVEKLGVKIAIVTGRPGYDAQYHAKLIGNQTYYVGSNGTVAGCVGKDDIIFEESISKERLELLRLISKQIGVKPVLLTKDQTIIHGFKDFIMHKLMSKIFPHDRGKHMKYIPNAHRFYTWMREEKTSIQKAMFFISDRKKAANAKKVLAAYPDFEVAVTSDICFEMTEKGMHKGHGVKKLIEHIHIPVEKVIAFGDSENDRAMLKYVGHGVAMGNAPDNIKAIAKTIADTNDEDGVAKVLQEIYALD